MHMTPTDIALVILGCAAYGFGAWRFAQLRAEVSAVAERLGRVHTYFAERLKAQAAAVDTLQKQSPVLLAAQVAELADAVERFRKIQQRMQGRMDQRRQSSDVDPDEPEDPKWLALRRAQQWTPPNGGA